MKRVTNFIHYSVIFCLLAHQTPIFDLKSQKSHLFVLCGLNQYNYRDYLIIMYLTVTQ